MPERLNPPMPTRTRKFARQLRQSSTDAELRLWHHLRGSRLGGFKFRRQHPIPPYMLDFFCVSTRIAVELDGSQHSVSADLERTRFLERQGIGILRFWDNDVLNKTEAVLEAILQALQDPTLTPTPLPVGEGLKTSIEP
jgi:very-short-patch-repair endonuclease